MRVVMAAVAPLPWLQSGFEPFLLPTELQGQINSNWGVGTFRPNLNHDVTPYYLASKPLLQ